MKEVLLVVLPPLFGLLGVYVGARLTTSSQEKLAQLDRAHRLSVAALEKRLEVHQAAYALWRKATAALHDPSINEVVIECQEWWDENCIYLGAGAREAFATAYRRAENHSNLLEIWRSSGSSEDSESVRENWEVVWAAGPALVRAMELPGLETEQSPQSPGAFGED